MLLLGFEIIFLLVAILFSAQLFSNALEHLGETLNLSSGVVGSLFAAVATALPETMIPIIALLFGGNDIETNQAVSTGAILGAPLMLSTLSLMVLGLSAIKKRGLRGFVKPEKNGLMRDLNFFLIAFFLVLIIFTLPVTCFKCRISIGFLLIALYFFYVLVTVKHSKKLVKEGHGVVAEEPLYLSWCGFKKNNFSIIMQLLLGLLLLLISAKYFINDIETIAHSLNASAFLLSLLIVPLATELPEKVNSVLWIRKNKDTLGFNNITGAMVFQSTLLPALGMMFMPWHAEREIIYAILATIAAVLWLKFHFGKAGIQNSKLIMCGFFYLIFIIAVLW